MKCGTNPLYPRSEGEGIRGAYEEAALIDDSERSFRTERQRKTGKIDWEENIGLAEETERARREFSAENKETMREYHERLRALREQKKADEISRAEFHELKRKLARETDKRNWGNLKKFWFG